MATVHKSSSLPPYEPSFLRLCPETERELVSTRGQHLPGIIRRLSVSSLRHPGSPFAASETSDSDGRTTGLHVGLENGFAATNGDLETGAWDGDLSWMPDDVRETVPAVTHMEGETGQQIKRSMRLIGNTGPHYPWERYFTHPEKLKQLRPPVRKYYERMNSLITRYLYIDRVLASSIAHELIEDYEQKMTKSRSRLQTIVEEPPISPPTGMPTGVLPEDEPPGSLRQDEVTSLGTSGERTVAPGPDRPVNEQTPLLGATVVEAHSPVIEPVRTGPVESTDRIVILAIYVNLLANILLLVAKIAIMALTSSVSVLASLVDASLDFLSTAIVWFTTRVTAKRDRYQYPVGRRRLEPVGVLIFSTIMITSFFQVALISFQKLTSGDQTLVELGTPAIAIMASTVAVKLLCWLWCRRINNSNVQALAQDAMTDVVFNIFSIIFPLVGTYAKLWPLDPLGGLFLSLYIMINWGRTANEHIAHLTGAAADPDERNVLLYLVTRFAQSIKYIQGLEAYHSGDKLNVEVDIVLDGNTNLHDSHDLGESLQYMIESIPTVDRAFVHLDYAYYNLPTHFDRDWK
ncbi:hypothetical protein VTN02DRAFT_6394 [Thermoascus thermophilus]